MQCLKDLLAKTALKYILIGQPNEAISLVKLAWRSSLRKNSLKYLLGPKTPFLCKKCFSWCLDQLFRYFKWKYCAVSQNIISMSVMYLHFSHCTFLFFIQWIDLGSKNLLQLAQFWMWLPQQQNPQNLRAWCT